MKNIVFICIILMTTTLARSQEEIDTVKLKFGDMKLIIIDDEKNLIDDSDFKDIFDSEDKFKEERKGNKVWAGLDLGVNGYLNTDNKTKVPEGYNYLDLDYARSITFSFNFLEKDIRLIDEYVKFTTGLGIEWNKYTFSNDTRLGMNGDQLTGEIDSVQSFIKSKLKLTYINLPLLLTFNTNKTRKKGAQLSAGVILGYKTGEKTKIVYEDDDSKKHKDIEKGDFNTNPFSYKLTARLSFNKFRFFATYNLNPLFAEDEGPELYPFSVGVTLLSL